MNNQEIVNDLLSFTEKLKGRGYAESTINTYTGIARNYLNQTSNARRATSNEIQSFINKYAGESATMGQVRGTLQNLYRWVYGQYRKFDDIPYVKKQHKQPVWLSIEETHALISSIYNLKQRALVQLTYSCALRASEAVNIKIKNISDGFISIRNTKGGKDRQIPIPEETLNLLRNYFTRYKPIEYLFEGQFGGAYSKESLLAIIKKAAKKAGIKKDVKTHSLRHSRATHWLNNGLQTRHVQELLGHKNIKTTETYTHIAQDDIKNIVSNADVIIKQKAKYLTQNQKYLSI